MSSQFALAPSAPGAMGEESTKHAAQLAAEAYLAAMFSPLGSAVTFAGGPQ